MREIIFRGKRIDNGEWVFGSYVKTIKSEKHYILIEHDFTDEQLFHEVIPESVSQYTRVKDKNKKKIYGNDRVRVVWTAELGITELGCEAEGTVRYMADGITAAWFVLFDSKYTRNVNCEMSYEEKWMELVQADEEMTVEFELLEEK